MRKLFASILALFAGAAIAATTTPVQLLSPTGSTAGQAIVSNGSSSAPTWQTVSSGSLAPIAANTVLGNFTGASAAPAAFAVSSCSTANSALKYTSGTGLSCGTTFALTSGNLSQFAATTSAQLLGVLSDETGTGVAVFGTSPSLTTPTIAGATLSGTFSGGHTYSGAVAFTSTITPSSTAGIVGTTTNDNANAGAVGEHISNSASGVALSTGVAANITSIALTAGDWEVTGTAGFSPAGTTTVSSLNAGISTTSGVIPVPPQATIYNLAFTTGALQIFPVPTLRISLASPATIYLVGAAAFGVSTMTAQAQIRARRVR